MTELQIKLSIQKGVVDVVQKQLDVEIDKYNKLREACDKEWGESLSPEEINNL
jgi:hypothetical protein